MRRGFAHDLQQSDDGERKHPVQFEISALPALDEASGFWGRTSMWRYRMRSSLGIADIRGPFDFAAEVGAQESRCMQLNLALQKF